MKIVELTGSIPKRLEVDSYDQNKQFEQLFKKKSVAASKWFVASKNYKKIYLEPITTILKLLNCIRTTKNENGGIFFTF